MNQRAAAWDKADTSMITTLNPHVAQHSSASHLYKDAGSADIATLPTVGTSGDLLPIAWVAAAGCNAAAPDAVGCRGPARPCALQSGPSPLLRIASGCLLFLAFSGVTELRPGLGGCDRKMSAMGQALTCYGDMLRGHYIRCIQAMSLAGQHDRAVNVPIYQHLPLKPSGTLRVLQLLLY